MFILYIILDFYKNNSKTLSISLFFYFYKFINLFYINFFSSNFKFKLRTLVNLKKKIFFLKKKDLVKKVIFIRILDNFKKLYSVNYNFYKYNNFNNKSNNSNFYNFYDFKKKFLTLLAENRKMLNFFFFKNSKKQNKITKFVKFLSKKKIHSHNYVDNMLFCLLIKSQFVFFLKDSFKMIESGLVFINNTLTTNPFTLLSIGDRVQLININSLKIYINNLFLYFKKKIIKFKIQNWRFFRVNKSVFSKSIFKKNSKVLYNFLFYKFDLPKNLEVDYITLNAVVLYKNKRENYNMFLMKFLSNYMLRLYNWKKN